MKFTFEQVKPILAKLNEAGYLAYLVGGSTRDYLLYGDFNDIDIATSAKPSEVASIFNVARYDKFAAKFGTFKGIIDGLNVEITTFRVEGEYIHHRHPSKVTFIKDPELDAKRRDLTINALYLDSEGKITDFYDGQKDLENKIIKLIGDPEERLEEDPVRILRIIRFAYSLNFKIDQDTVDAMNKKMELIDEISLQRQKMEFQKLLKLASIEEIKNIFDKYNIDIKGKAL